MSPSDRVMARIDALAAITSEAGKLTRLAFTPQMTRANALVADWLREAGFTVRTDAAGNLIGRIGGDGPALALGSHLDTVRDAGRFDGMLGILVAIEAVEALNALPCPVEILCFGDEEGVRFGTTVAGSLALSGDWDPSRLELKDADGITVRRALADFGLDPDRIGDAAAKDAYVGYLEVHIEQGPVLDDAGVPLGIVTGIAGATRAMIRLDGKAGHAGTVPMAARQDAFMAAAHLALRIEAIAKAHDALATIGQIVALPGAVNVIPAQVTMTLDLRAARDEDRLAAWDRILSAPRQGTAATFEILSQSDASPCAGGMRDLLRRAAAVANADVPEIASGAGHDGSHMARICDYGMLFLRCAGGVSHDPSESVLQSDVDHAIRALTTALRDYRA